MRKKAGKQIDRELKTSLPAFISTRQQAEEFMKELKKNHELFDWESDFSEPLINERDGSRMVLTKAQQIQLESLLSQMENIEGFDPHQYSDSLSRHLMADCMCWINPFSDVETKIKFQVFRTNIDREFLILN